jgi:hypothetical protein
VNFKIVNYLLFNNKLTPNLGYSMVAFFLLKYIMEHIACLSTVFLFRLLSASHFSFTCDLVMSPVYPTQKSEFKRRPSSFFKQEMGDATLAATTRRRDEVDRDRDNMDDNNIIFFIDADSIRAAGQTYLTRRYEAERQQILGMLPAAYQSRWRTVGFVDDKPVMIVGLYDVPYGPIRRLWMEAFVKVRVPLRQESGQNTDIGCLHRRSPLISHHT